MRWGKISPVLAFIFIAAGLAAFGLGYWILRLHFEERDKVLADGFQRALQNQLMGNETGTACSISSLASELRVSAKRARIITRDTYTKVASQVYADGVVTPGERKSLQDLGRRLELTTEEMTALEAPFQAAVYSSAVHDALADGVLSEKEALRLKRIRENFGISAQTVTRRTDPAIRSYLEKSIDLVLTGGGLSKDGGDWFDKQALDLGVDVPSARRLFQSRGSDAYRNLSASLLQEGSLDPERVRRLERLKSFFALGEDVTRPVEARLAELQQIVAIRSGQIPVLQTDLQLEASERCHAMQSAATIPSRGRLAGDKLTGVLAVTSARLIFVGRDAGYEFSLGSIVNCTVEDESITIMVTGVRGGAHVFWMDRARIVGEILVAAIKAVNRHLIENFDAVRSRYIPEVVRSTVWRRDRGRCVDCESQLDLEFDHIIPFSKGGASSENNLQLLCRTCNGKKSDRI